MASTYPGSLDSFDTIASDKKTSDSVGGRTHRDMHNDLGDAIEAVQAELGTDPAGASATVKARFEVIEALHLSGTVAPNGAVTAVPLTRYRQTSGATTATGVMEWVKASGSGNTGWVASADADTGWRDVSSLLFSGLAVSSSEGLCVIRRRGTQVDVRVKVDCTSGSVNVLFAVPTGFLPTQDKRRQWPMFQASSAGAVLPPPVTANHFYMSVGNSTLASIEYFPNPGTVGGSMSWETADAWPSSLPGSAA